MSKAIIKLGISEDSLKEPFSRQTPAESHKPALVMQPPAAEDRVLRWPGLDRGIMPPLLAATKDPRAEEQYRIARTKLLQNPRKPSVVVVSSPGPGDGKTMTAIQLAATLSLAAEGRVLLVEADLRRPSASKYLNAPLKPGLSEVLAGTAALDGTLYRVEPTPNLWILGAGGHCEAPAEMLASSRWRDLVSTLRKTFRWIVIDTPPIGIVADFDMIEAVSDGVVLVLRPDHTDRTLSFQAIRNLGERLIGIITNGMQDWFLWKPYRNSYYYEGEPSGGRGKAK
jgi:capsular exopolysaccharide synthesis family protein